MDTGPVQSAAPFPAGNSPAGRPTSASALSSDFETFLKMLTAQLQNQDPLNPLESTDFAVQLATFSGVEQQVRTNELLGQLAGEDAGSRLSELSAWIGQEVRVATPVAFEGAPVTLYPEPIEGAERTILAVRDSTGRLVASGPVPNDGAAFDWAGVGDDGTPLPPDTYAFSIEGYTGAAFSGSAEVSHFANVTEVRMTSDGPRIALSGGVEVDPNEVLAVRAAAAGL